jgi:hypothetical protein
MVGELDFILEHGRGVAGAVQDDAVLWGWMLASICSESD